MAGTVLVTGGAGFIGSAVVGALLERGDTVRVIDDLSTGRVTPALLRAEVHVADIVDPRAAATAMAGVDRVVHLAAWRAVPRSFADPTGTDRVNRGGTRVVLAAARRAGVRRVVLASSSSVYGQATRVPTPESAPLAPLSPYARSKVAAEALAVRAASAGVDTVRLRYFNVYGPGQEGRGPYATLIPRVVERLRRGEPITIDGDGRQRRDFSFIDDVVRATLAALDAPEPLAGAAINVAGGRSVTVREAVDAVAAALGVVPVVRHGAARPGDPRHTEADLRWAADRLGYAPSVVLAEGVPAVVRAALVAEVA